MHAASTAGAGRAPVFPRNRVAVSAAFLANGLVVGGWAPQIPLFAARHGIDERVLGLVILVFGLGSLAAMPVVGAAISRVGSRRPVLLLQLLLVPSLPLIVLAPNLWLAFPAALFFGLTVGGMDVAMNANAVSTERAMRRSIMSSAHGFWSVGGFLGAGAGGYLIAALGPAGHAVVTGLATLLLILPVTLGMTRDAPAPGEAAAPGEGGVTGFLAALRRDRTAALAALLIGVFALFTMVPEGTAVDWSAIYLVRDLGADTQTSGLAFAAFSATMALFRFGGDLIRDRFGAVATVRGSLLFGIAGLWLIAAAGSPTVAVLGFAVLGVGLSNVVPVAFSAAGNVAGLKPGIGIAIATGLGYSGILLAPSVIGVLAASIGFPAVFAGLSALLVVVLLGAGALRGADRRDH